MTDNTKLIPIFLLGAGRSGTKFLRDILGESSNLAVIPYDIGYVWRYGNEICSHDEFTVDMLTDSTKNYIKKTLPQLVKNSPSKAGASFFVEKSVPNTLRPLFLEAIYPDAKFIHLIRDGRAVTESALRQWKTPPDKGYLLKKLRYFPWKSYKYALWYLGNIIKGKLSSGRGQQTWGPRYDGIDNDTNTLPLEVVCARQWSKCINTSLSQLSEFKQENILEIRYEDLMRDSQTIEKVSDFLNLQDKDAVIKNFESKVNRTHTNKWKNSLSAKQLDLIDKEIKILNTSLGYPD